MAGKLTARFGETRAGGVRWNGLLIASDRGTPVTAVHDGRVVYADWLPGLGLLIIVDHGNGYLSLYGHNEHAVQAGRRDSGRRATPLRRPAIRVAAVTERAVFRDPPRGKPVDPRPWFRSALPQGLTARAAPKRWHGKALHR